MRVSCDAVAHDARRHMDTNASTDHRLSSDYSRGDILRKARIVWMKKRTKGKAKFQQPIFLL